ncbi:hypothetical protein [Pseudoxanthomonas sp. PXM04]|uniref:hypothetical protein n=1 Tax=Pseudoxanthomonas sp. PXM04 TaxID=2769297 RepID=UPI001781D07F|nr:hypothetical protein [Pseudoxanthomonas sp. PXM04]MBD9375932.1 hypothetical protein [Pseudoxanthomonas sp. PXM04]
MKRGSGFAERVAAAFPVANPLPPLLWQALDWLDVNGFVGGGRSGQVARLYPGQEPGSSRVTLRIPARDDTRAWTRSEHPRVNDRLVLFVDTGLDGSRAGLWLDDHGHQRLVHVGAPEGPALLCELADDPVHLLRLLALGYPELSAPDYFAMAPAEAYAMGYGLAVDYLAPLRFRAYVERDLDLDVPATASIIVRRIASLHDRQSDDRFWRWLAETRNGQA